MHQSTRTPLAYSRVNPPLGTMGEADPVLANHLQSSQVIS